jgi:hypothetical protein
VKFAFIPLMKVDAYPMAGNKKKGTLKRIPFLRR